jgi:hypothetical protein
MPDAKPAEAKPVDDWDSGWDTPVAPDTEPAPQLNNEEWFSQDWGGWERGSEVLVAGSRGKVRAEVSRADSEIVLVKLPEVPVPTERVMRTDKLPLAKGEAVVIDDHKLGAVWKIIQDMRGGERAQDHVVLVIEEAAGLLRVTVWPEERSEVFDAETTILNGAAPTTTSVRLWLAGLIEDESADAVVIDQRVAQLTLRSWNERDACNPDGSQRIADRLAKLANDSGAAFAVVCA